MLTTERLIHGLGVWLALSLVACGVATQSPVAPLASRTPPASTPVVEQVTAAHWVAAPCPFVLPTAYRDGQEVQCGWLAVPEDRRSLPSRAIRLAVAVFHPAGGAAAPDPIIYLSGGPGGSALEALQYEFEAAFAPILTATQRDLVLFDQRGVGVSRPALDCANAEALALGLLDAEQDGQQLTLDEVASRMVAAYAECARQLSEVADLSTYNSNASAADVNDLRQALGYERVNLWGASYGTRLALEIIRDYPEALRSVVLDSVYPPDVDLFADGPANAQRAFNLLFASCEANPVCSAAHPDLATVFYDTVERLNTTPATGVITDPLTGTDYQAAFTGDALVGLVFQVLYDTDLRYALPQLIDDVSRGDFTAIDQIRGALLARRFLTSPGMMLSVECHEAVPFSSIEAYEQTAAQFPELRGFFDRAASGRLTYRLCEHWPSGQAPDTEHTPVSSEIPTLVMAGEFDPITPPDWAWHAAETLTNSHTYVFPGVGHGASFQPRCPREMLIEFIRDPYATPWDRCGAQ